MRDPQPNAELVAARLEENHKLYESLILKT